MTMTVPGPSPRQFRVNSWFPLLWCSVIIIFFFSVLGEFFGESQDWQNYVNLFDALRASGINVEGTAERVEIGFKLLAFSLVALSLSNLLIYALISALSLLFKFIAINSFTNKRYVFIVAIGYYLVCTAPLHELTQIRAALAISMLFLSYVLLMRGFLVVSLLAALLSVFCHISAVSTLPLLIAVALFEKNAVEITRARIGILALCAYLALAAVISALLSSLDDALLVVEAYLEEGFGDESVNPLSATILLNIAISAVAWLRWFSLSANMKYVLFFELLGLAVFYATIDFPVIALRLYEFFQAFWVLFVVEGLDSRDWLIRFGTWIFTLLSIAGYGYIYFLSGTFFL